MNTLTDEGGRLKEGLKQTEDFETLPQPVWKALYSWFVIVNTFKTL